MSIFDFEKYKIGKCPFVENPGTCIVPVRNYYAPLPRVDVTSTNPFRNNPFDIPDRKTNPFVQETNPFVQETNPFVYGPAPPFRDVREIPPRDSGSRLAQLQSYVSFLEEKIKALEEENARLRRNIFESL